MMRKLFTLIAIKPQVTKPKNTQAHKITSFHALEYLGFCKIATGFDDFW